MAQFLHTFKNIYDHVFYNTHAQIFNESALHVFVLIYFLFRFYRRPLEFAKNDYAWLQHDYDMIITYL